jgi:hypothetical protein
VRLIYDNIELLLSTEGVVYANNDRNNPGGPLDDLSLLRIWADVIRFIDNSKE